MPCSRPWKPGSGTPLGARLKGLIFHDRRVEFLRIWSQERPGQACVPAASVGWGWWRPEARGQSGSGRCWKGGQARAVLRRSDGGLWGRTGCPHCWSCSQRTRRSWWACPHTTCPVRWPLPILMAGLPRPPPPASHSVRSLAQKVGVSPRGLWSASQLCSQQESGLLCFIGLVSVSLSLGLLPWATPPRSAGTQPCPGISTPRTGVLVPLRPATSSPG